MDAGTFSLDVGVERILDVMGRSADATERKGDRRLFIYIMADGSEVVFVMVPRGGLGSGLRLDYVTAR